MKKIEPAAYMTYKGYLLHAADPKVSEHDSPEPLYTREALEAVAKAVQQAAFGVAWDDNDRREIKQIDTAAIISQLTGE